MILINNQHYFSLFLSLLIFALESTICTQRNLEKEKRSREKTEALCVKATSTNCQCNARPQTVMREKNIICRQQKNACCFFNRYATESELNSIVERTHDRKKLKKLIWTAIYILYRYIYNTNDIQLCMNFQFINSVVLSVD